MSAGAATDGAAGTGCRRVGRLSHSSVRHTPTLGLGRSSQLSEHQDRSRRRNKISDSKQPSDDLAILEQLNLDYNRADQASDARRFSEFLAEDFIVQTPGTTRNREEFLEYIAKPRPFKDLALREANVRILGDVALIHGRATYTMLADGAEQEALYTDVYQKRAGTWVCVSACAIAPGS
jgi:ketosteroid isomerase-like protein